MLDEIIGYVLAIAALACIGVVLTNLLKGVGTAGAGIGFGIGKILSGVGDTVGKGVAGLGSMIGSVLTGLGKGAGDAAKGALTGGGRAARDTMKGLRGGRKQRGTHTYSDPARARKSEDDSSIGLGTAALALGFEAVRRGANTLFGGNDDGRGASQTAPHREAVRHTASDTVQRGDAGTARSCSQKRQSWSGRRTKSSSKAAKQKESTWRRAADAAKKSGKGFDWFAGKVRGDDDARESRQTTEESFGNWQPFVGHAFAVDEATLQQLHDTLGDTVHYDVQYGDDGRMYAVFQPEQWQVASDVLNDAGWAVDGWGEPEYAEADVVVDPEEGIVIPVQPRGPGLPGDSNTPNPSAGGRAVYERYGTDYMREIGGRGAAARHANRQQSAGRRVVGSLIDSIIDTVKGG